MRRNVWLVVLALGIAVMLAFSLAGSTREPEPLDPPLYDGVPLDAALIRMDKRALDEAYHDQIKKLFMVWIASQAPSDAANLRNGLRIARRAYYQAASQITRREQELLDLDRRQLDRPQ